MYSHIIVKYNHPDQTALCPMYCDCDIVMLVSEQKENSLPEAPEAVKKERENGENGNKMDILLFIC